MAVQLSDCCWSPFQIPFLPCTQGAAVKLLHPCMSLLQWRCACTVMITCPSWSGCTALQLLPVTSRVAVQLSECCLPPREWLCSDCLTPLERWCVCTVMITCPSRSGCTARQLLPVTSDRSCSAVRAFLTAPGAAAWLLHSCTARRLMSVASRQPFSPGARARLPCHPWSSCAAVRLWPTLSATMV